jgi:hypothetical protein
MPRMAVLEEGRLAPRTRLMPKTELARSLFGLALFLASALFAWALTRPLDWLLVVVPDDAFYYLGIARNLARSGLSSFDGVHLTNGYHPGWMAIAALNAAFFREPLPQLRALLVSAFLFHVGASVMIVLAARKFTSEARALVAGALWLVSVLPFRLTLQGMEGSFYIFALTLAWLLYMTRFYRKERPTSQAHAAFGLGLALCVWGRTEAMMLAMVVIPIVSLSLRRTGWLRPLLIMSLAFAAGIAPWIAYSRVATGTWFQQSGAMKLLWAAEAPPALVTRLWHGVQYLLGTWVSLPVLGGLDGAAHGWRGAMNAVALLTLFALILAGLRRESSRDLARIGLVMLAATLLTGAYYAFLSSDRQFWYKAQPGLILHLVLFFTGAEVLSHRSSLSKPAVVAIGLGLFVVALFAVVGSLRTYPWQKDVYHSQQRFEGFVPKGERIGCFNAGIPGFFSSRQVINLDGLVNNSITGPYRARSVERYLAKEQIHWIADENSAWTRAERFMGKPPEREVVATSPLTGSDPNGRFLWRIRPIDDDAPR